MTAEGRIRRGAAVLFPNLHAYSSHSSASIYSADLHYLPLGAITEQLMADNIATQVEFARAVMRTNPDSRWASINANHMLPSGSSLFHPHLQGIVDSSPRRTSACWRRCLASALGRISMPSGAAASDNAAAASRSGSLLTPSAVAVSAGSGCRRTFTDRISPSVPNAPTNLTAATPATGANALRDAGVALVNPPKDYDLNRIMGEITDLLGKGSAVCPNYAAPPGTAAALRPADLRPDERRAPQHLFYRLLPGGAGAGRVWNSAVRHQRRLDRIGVEQLIGVWPERVHRLFRAAPALRRPIAQPHHPFRRVAQVVRRLLLRLRGDRGNGRVGRDPGGFAPIGIECGAVEELANHGVCEVAVWLLDEQAVPPRPLGAEIGQLVLGLARGRADLLIQRPRQPDLVEPDIGERQVFLGRRRVAAPLREAVAQDQRVIGPAQKPQHARRGLDLHGHGWNLADRIRDRSLS